MLKEAKELFALERPLVIAHRGYSGVAPENTLPAFEMALEVEPDLVELDYYHTRDGVPLVFHDRTLDRTTNARDLWSEEGLTVGSRTVRELSHLDAGEWFHPRFRGTRLLTLVEALDFIQPRGITLIERKSGDPETLVDLLRQRDELNRVVVQSFDWKFIAECRKVEPSLALGALGPPASRNGHRLTVEERVLNDRYLDEVQQAGAQIVGWNGEITSEAVDEAHRRGLMVFVYVVNSLDTAAELLRVGVDGLISDRPGLMWKAIAEQGENGVR